MPLLYSRLDNNTIIQLEDYYNAYEAIFFLPGPIGGISVFIATFFKHGLLRSGACSLIAFISYNIPSFFFVSVALANLSTYKKMIRLRKFLKNVKVVSLGLFAGMILMLFHKCLLVRTEKLWSLWLAILFGMGIFLVRQNICALLVLILVNINYVIIVHYFGKGVYQ